MDGVGPLDVPVSQQKRQYIETWLLEEATCKQKNNIFGEDSESILLMSLRFPYYMP